MNEYDDLIYKQLTLHLSFDLYDNFGYLSKIKDPLEIKYISYGSNQFNTKDIAHLLDSIYTAIINYLSPDFKYPKEVDYEVNKLRTSNQTDKNQDEVAQ